LWPIPVYGDRNNGRRSRKKIQKIIKEKADKGKIGTKGPEMLEEEILLA